MIPYTLHIKNFLSYGPEIQVIDFSPHQLICLSGKNGHGKSALLDAITWALWGQGRKISGTAKADEGLLHLGQTQMMVILDFELNGTMYRAKREYTKTYGKPLATIEFGVLNTATNTISSLTDKTGRATQDIIDSTLNLDYETFINSAFLRQGQANEFSKKSPKERKQVLATILGLDRYEALRRRALDKAKNFLTRRQALELFKEKITQELSQKEALEQAYQMSEESLAIITTDMQMQEHALNDATVREKTLEISLNQGRILEFEYNQKEVLWTSLLHELRTTRNEWRKTRTLQTSVPDKKELDSAYRSLTEELILHQEKLAKTLELKEQFLHLQENFQKQLLENSTYLQKTSVLKERTRGTLEYHEKELIICAAEIESIHTQQKALSLEISTLQAKRASYTETHHQSIVIKKQFDKRKAFYQKLIALGNILSSQKSQLAQKDALVCNEENPSCPLCEQSVSASRRRFLRTTFAQEHTALTHRVGRITRLIQTLKNILYSQHEIIVSLEKAEIDNSKNEYTYSECTKKSADLEKKHAELIIRKETLEKTIDTYKNEMLSLTAAVSQQHTSGSGLLDSTHSAALDHIRKQIIEQQYQPLVHKQVQEKITALEKQRQAWNAIENTLQEQKKRSERVHELCSTLKSLKVQLHALTHEREKMRIVIAEYEGLQKKKSECISKVTTLRNQKEVLLQESTRLKTELAKIRRQEAELAIHLEEIKNIDTTIDDYQTIATAASKDGIQALLIEDAIPEIEQEANDLLVKLTNNQAQLFIESLRDLKKGGTKETLDIKISDPAGIRSYELFSGGEAFRIDFAIRIAISKLLARRAGTALQTLIIDEGFGSQDEEGLHLIMDALHRIQDSFHKIIIVSHLDALKDQFPVHFVVQKYPSGSTVSVIENG